MADKKARRNRGSGSLRSKVDYRTGKEYWTIGYYYYKDGRSIRVKDRTRYTTKGEAQKALSVKLTEVAEGRYVDTRPGKALTVADLHAALAKLVEANKKGRGKRSLAELQWRYAHLEPVFGTKAAATVTTKAVIEYTVQRQQAGAADATCNRELTCLKRIMNYARQIGMLHTPPPYIPLLKENNVRQGFIGDEEFEKLATAARAAKQPWLQLLLEMLYQTGWRRGELLTRKVANIDFLASTVSLAPGETKNGKGRTTPLSPAARQLLLVAVQGKGPDDYVFTWPDGRQVKDFRATWYKLFAAAGVELRLVHDFRRSCVRQLRTQGVSETVIMKMSGHLTNSVMKRYDIVDLTDQQEAVARREAARAQARELAQAQTLKSKVGPLEGVPVLPPQPMVQ